MKSSDYVLAAAIVATSVAAVYLLNHFMDNILVKA